MLKVIKGGLCVNHHLLSVITVHPTDSKTENFYIVVGSNNQSYHKYRDSLVPLEKVRLFSPLGFDIQRHSDIEFSNIKLLFVRASKRYLVKRARLFAVQHATFVGHYFILLHVVGSLRGQTHQTFCVHIVFVSLLCRQIVFTEIVKTILLRFQIFPLWGSLSQVVVFSCRVDAR